MNAEQIAQIVHEANRAYCATIGDFSQAKWDEAPDWQKASAIDGVAANLRGEILTSAQTKPYHRELFFAIIHACSEKPDDTADDEQTAKPKQTTRKKKTSAK